MQQLFVNVYVYRYTNQWANHSTLKLKELIHRRESTNFSLLKHIWNAAFQFSCLLRGSSWWPSFITRSCRCLGTAMINGITLEVSFKTSSFLPSATVVMFSQECVKNSVKGGVHGGRCAWWGVCMAGGVHGRGHEWRGMHGKGGVCGREHAW